MFGINRLQNEVRRLGEAPGVSPGSDPTDHPLLSFYVHTTAKLIGAERCSIFVLNPQTRRVWLKHGTGVSEHGIEVNVEGSMVGRVIATGEPAIDNNLSSRDGVHRQVESDLGFVTRNLACVPIRDGQSGEVVGAVEVLNKRQGEFTAADVAELTELARYLQMTIETIFHSQEIVGTMTKVVRFGQAVVVIFAGAVVALTAIMVFYVLGVVAMRG